MVALLAVVLCLATGFVIVCLGWSRQSPLSHLLLKASLSAGCGLGIFSLVYFLFPVLSLSGLIPVDLVVLGALLVCLIRVRKSRTPELNPVDARAASETSNRSIARVLAGGFALSLVFAVYSSAMRVLANPHGAGWDAFAIWNLRARFLFRGGPHWKDGFSASLPWSHPDYPLLLPASIAHFWRYLGTENQAVPCVIALVFMLSTVGLLVSSLSALRGSNQGLLGGIVLLGTPFFVEQGTAQYADVPLGFFVMATIVLLCLHEEGRHGPRLLGLAGLMAGLAAWTKNEGLLFLSAIVLERMLVLLRHEGRKSCWRQMAPMLLAALPVLLVLGYFKLRVAPAGDLFSGANSTLHKVLAPDRYWAIVKWYGKEFMRFGHWMLIPGTVVLAAYYFLVGKHPIPDTIPDRLGIRSSVLAIALTLAGYFAVYVITPYDIYWHLRFSLNRLFLQLWPSAIFLFFMVVRTPEQALAE
jgi:hypothetical protein